MNKEVCSRFGTVYVLIALFFVLIACPNSVQAKSKVCIELDVDQGAGTCDYTITGLGTEYMEKFLNLRVVRSDNGGLAYEEQVYLDDSNCEDNTYEGMFATTDMKDFRKTKYTVTAQIGTETFVASKECDFSEPVNSPSVSSKPVVSSKPTVSAKPISSAKPVPWKFTADKNTGATTRVFEYAPSVVGGSSKYVGNEASIYVWKKEPGSLESKAILVGEKQLISNEKLVWKVNIAKFEKGYGTYYVKLIVSKDNEQKMQELSHIIIQPSATSFTTSVTNALEGKQAFEINLKGLTNPYGVKKVRFDLYNGSEKVYSCAGAAKNSRRDFYTATVNMKDLGYKLGLYVVKATVTDRNGNQKMVSTTATADRRAKAGKIKATSHSDKTFAFTLKDAYIPGTIKKVTFEVYRKADGNKKVRFYNSTYQASTKTYTGKMDISSFPYKNTGAYQVNAYGYTQWGTKVLLNQTAFRLKGATATVKGNSPSSVKGTFSMTVGNINSNSGVSSVEVKVWGASERKDARTYKAVKQSNGNYKITVDVSNHAYHFGGYHAKVYVTMGNGILVKAATGTYTFEPKNFVYMKDSDIQNSKKVYLYNPSTKGTVTFEVYSETKGKDDLAVYRTVKSGSSYYSLIKLSEIKHAGKIIVKARIGNKAVRTYTFSLKKNELAKNGWTYENYDGKTYKFYYEDGQKVTDLTKILGIKESSDANVNNFKIVVNRAACCVTVYAYDSVKRDYCIPVKTCTVSIGRDTSTNKGPEGLNANTSYTPIGDFTICTNGTSVKFSMKPMYEPDGSICYARWASHVVGNVYFHSIAVSSDSHYALNPNNYNKLGTPASAGCIRMTVADAKWFYDYVSKGTPVKIVTGNASVPGPLGKNATIKIASSIHYDPTDPDVPNATKEKDFKAGRISGYMTSSGKRVGY